ncbi:MAG TPA: Sec-independent protein translocase protein TatB [Polyangiaceae bacterium]|nr:Sec-independent protein translocase protein TatB [Polyangiaceae bacterium]
MFGFSFSELLMICVVALIFVGPKKLPGMLHSLGQFIRKMRNMTNDVRNQTGIDQLLRAEGLHGGLNELRGLLRVNHGLSFDAPNVPSPPPTVEPTVTTEPTMMAPAAHVPVDDPYAHIDIDTTREYPPEGADAYGALPDDLLPYEPSVSVPASASPTPEASSGTAPEAAAEATTETTTEATAEATTPSA